MTTMDRLTCIGGSFHGQTKLIPKDHPPQVRFPILTRPHPVVQASSVIDMTRVSDTAIYRRIPMTYPDQPGAFSILVHDSIPDEDAAHAYQAWRQGQ